MRIWPLLFCLAACGDETVTAFSDNDEFQLISINDVPFGATATLNIAQAGVVSGAAPCNRYNATQSAPYPWFDLGPIAATKRACPDLAEESQFFNALERMTIVEVSGRTLILSNDDKEEMLFQAP